MKTWYLSELGRRVNGGININMDDPQDHENLELAAHIALKFDADSIAALPQFALSLVPYFEKYNVLKNIKVVELYGDACSESRRKEILDAYNNPILVSNYSLSEVAGVMGTACSYTMSERINSFHFTNNLFLFEFIDPETGTVRTPEIPSELVISSLTTDQPFPLIRYRTGDLVVIEEKLCACGNKTPRFRFVKRSKNERIRSMHYEWEISQDCIKTAVDKCSAFIEDDFEAHYYEIPDNSVQGITRPMLDIKVRLKKQNTNIDTLAPLLSKYIQVNSKETYSDMQLKKTFAPLTVSLLLPKNGQTEKSTKVRLFNHA